MLEVGIRVSTVTNGESFAIIIGSEVVFLTKAFILLCLLVILVTSGVISKPSLFFW